VRLIAFDGKEVYNSDFTGLNHKINIVDLSKGIYFLHLLDENEYLIQKIIVQ